MKNTTTISIDLAKNVFQVAVFNKYGKLKSNEAMNGKKMVLLVAQHPEASICMEACSHVLRVNAYWVFALRVLMQRDWKPAKQNIPLRTLRPKKFKTKH